MDKRIHVRDSECTKTILICNWKYFKYKNYLTTELYKHKYK